MRARDPWLGAASLITPATKGDRKEADRQGTESLVPDSPSTQSARAACVSGYGRKMGRRPPETAPSPFPGACSPKRIHLQAVADKPPSFRSVAHPPALRICKCESARARFATDRVSYVFCSFGSLPTENRPHGRPRVSALRNGRSVAPAGACRIRATEGRDLAEGGRLRE